MSERRLSDAELQASRWIARLEASDVTLEDHKRFRAWLDAAPENRAAHEAVSRSWDKLDGLKLLGPELASEVSPALAKSPSRRRLLLAGGAGAGIVAASAIGLWIATPATTFAATYQTSVGGRERATLQDGSEIELNALTSVEAAYTERSRTVTLDRGEALFLVVTDQRPFRINTRVGSILAASPGTYLVKALDGAVRVSVIRGSIETRSVDSPLVAGNEAKLSNESVGLDALPPERAARRLAWQEHMLAFDGETLAEAAADVEAQTGVRFRFASAAIADLRVGGYIDGRDAQAFVALVEANLGVSARPQADGAIFFEN
jgi:transmembrane sensor